MKFPSERGALFGIIIWGVIMILTIDILSDLLGSEGLGFKGFHFIILLVIAFFLWIWFDTNYQIKGGNLMYRSGPIRGRIEIEKIRTVVKKGTLWSGLKPALATKGLILKYNLYDEIYISPREKDRFIKELLKINNRIEIVE